MEILDVRACGDNFLWVYKMSLSLQVGFTYKLQLIESCAFTRERERERENYRDMYGVTER